MAIHIGCNGDQPSWRIHVTWYPWERIIEILGEYFPGTTNLGDERGNVVTWTAKVGELEICSLKTYIDEEYN